MKKINYKYICYLLTPFIICLVVYLLKGIHYSIVDDTLINYITEGVYGSGQNQFIILPYIGVIFTYILFALKCLFTNFNIYFISMILCFTLTFVGLNHLYYKKYTSWLFFFAVSCVQSILMNYLTYTVVAYLMCIVGLLYLLEAEKRIEKFIGFMFVFLGIALRKDVFLSLIILFVPIIIYYLLKRNKKIMFGVIISFSIFLFVEISNKVVLADYPITQQYLEWNELSTKIRDYKPVEYVEYQEVFMESNISENDINSVYSWIFAEQDTLGNQQLKIITDQRKLTDTYDLNPTHIMETFLNNDMYLIYSLLTFVLLLVFKWKNYLGISVFLFTLADLTALIIRQRVVDRVFIPLMIASLFIILYYYRDMFNGIRFREYKKTIICGICLLSFVSVFIYGYQEKNWYSKNKFYKVSEVYKYVHNNPNNLYVFEGFGGVVNAQYRINTLRVNKNKLNKNLMTLGNWDTFSERYYTQMKLFGIDNPESFLANLDTYDNVYCLFREDSPKETLIKNWYKEHKNKTVIFEKVDKVSNLIVMRVRLI